MVIQRNPPATTMTVEIVWPGGQGGSWGWGGVWKPRTLELNHHSWMCSRKVCQENQEMSLSYLTQILRGSVIALGKKKHCVGNTSFCFQHLMHGGSHGVQQCTGLPAWLCQCHCASYMGVLSFFIVEQWKNSPRGNHVRSNWHNMCTTLSRCGGTSKWVCN